MYPLESTLYRDTKYFPMDTNAIPKGTWVIQKST